MAAVNEHTGRRIRTGSNSQDFRDNFDAIFGSKETKETKEISKPLPTGIGPTLF